MENYQKMEKIGEGMLNMADYRASWEHMRCDWTDEGG
jgi:hypothetical protein